MIALVLVVVPWITHGQGIAYTGVVQNDDGTPVDAACVRAGAQDTCDFRVRLYEHPTDGDSVWEMTVSDVEVGDTAGRFTLLLDCGGTFEDCATAEIDFTQPLYIAVTFDPSGTERFSRGVTFARQPVAAAAFAFAARTSAFVGEIAAADVARTDTDEEFTQSVRVREALQTQTLYVEDGVLRSDAMFTIHGLTVKKDAPRVGIGVETPAVALDIAAQDSGVRISALSEASLPALALTVAPTRSALTVTQPTDTFARLQITAQGQMIFGDGAVAADTMLYRAGAGVLATDGAFSVASLRIGTQDSAHPITTASGAHLTRGGVWTNASDRALKENFTDVDADDILSRVERLPISRWNYKSEDDHITHIGPTAQDFYAAFDVGGSDTSISTIDPAGVALVAIQALARRVSELNVAPQQMVQVEELSLSTADAQEVVTEDVAALRSEVAALREAINALQKERERAAADAVSALPPTSDLPAEEDKTIQSVEAKISETPAETPIVSETPLPTSEESNEEHGDGDTTTRSGAVQVPADTRTDRELFIAVPDITDTDAPTLSYAGAVGVTVTSVRPEHGFTIRVTGELTEDLTITWTL